MFNFMNSNKNTKFILLLCDNGLGDYFLVRNYFKYIKISKKYENHKIIFLAKPDRIDCLNTFDKKWIDYVIKFVPDKFVNNWFYRIKLLSLLKNKNITDIINIGCAYPEIDKEPKSTIMLLNAINAKNKIAHVIDPQHSSTKNKYNMYTKVIYTPRINLFEFERNRLFFEELLDLSINERKVPYIDFNLDTGKDRLIGISPFKRFEYISWDAENWAELCNLITEKFPQYKIVLIGTKNKKFNRIFFSKIVDKNKYINLFGKAKSCCLPKVIKSFEFLVSAETATAHIASTVSTPTIVLTNGAFYKRFQPIPCDFINYVYPKDFLNWKENYIDNGNLNPYYYGFVPYDLKDVSPASVLENINKILE